MTLLDVFTSKFVTEGLDDVSSDAQKADKDLDRLAETSENAEKQTKHLSNTAQQASESLNAEGNAAEEASRKISNVERATREASSGAKNLTSKLGNTGLEGVLLQGIKKFSPYILLIGALQNSFKMLQEAIELKVPISRQTVNNLKDFEMSLRDVRSGTAQIGASIAGSILPVVTKVLKFAKTILDFLKEHEQFIKIALIAAVIAFGVALWGVLAPILPELIAINAILIGISLLLDDFITWLNGGNSALEDFWNAIFGSADEAKAFFKEISALFKEIWELIQPAISWLNEKGLKLMIEQLKLTALALKVMVDLIKQAVESVNLLINGFKNMDASSIAKGLKGLVLPQLNPNDYKNFLPKKDGSHASGLDYVPFDGYIAELHKGESVLTSAEANDWRSGLLAAKNAINFTAAYPLNSIPSGAMSNAYNNTSNSKTINIGDITIQTQATDSQGIATDIASYIKQAVINLDDGMLA